MVNVFPLRIQKGDYTMGLSPRLVITAIALILGFSQFSSAQDDGTAYMAVSYTHLTLPTNREV